MTVAVPVRDESLTIFTNAGHAPFFAIFESKGTGMFCQFDLVEMRENPRFDMDAEAGCGHEHEGDPTEGGEEHRQEHLEIAELVKGCDVFLGKSACSHTADVIKDQGVEVRIIPESEMNAKNALHLAL